MRYVLNALALVFGLEVVFMVILVVVSAVEGHRAKREAVVERVRFLRAGEPSGQRQGRASA
jgi:hypothetical protein